MYNIVSCWSNIIICFCKRMRNENIVNQGFFDDIYVNQLSLCGGGFRCSQARIMSSGGEKLWRIFSTVFLGIQQHGWSDWCFYKHSVGGVDMTINADVVVVICLL